MNPGDVARQWQSINDEPDPRKWLPGEAGHYLNVIYAIASGTAEPDPVTLAKAVVHEIATRHIPEGD